MPEPPRANRIRNTRRSPAARDSRDWPRSPGFAIGPWLLLASLAFGCDRPPPPDPESAPTASDPGATAEGGASGGDAGGLEETSPGSGAAVVGSQVVSPPLPTVVPLPGAPESFSDLVGQVHRGVVYVYTTTIVSTRRAQPQWGYPNFPPGYGAPEPQVRQSLGSGFIVDGDGFILTNSHVIEGATEVRVRTWDDREMVARIVGIDPSTDLAVIQVPPFPGIQPLPLGDSDGVRVGDWVVAVGNPFGLSATVTAGIVSAMGRRDIPVGGRMRFSDFIQTDASINPGNSGGPLVDMQGEVVGINTLIYAEGQGLGFAIPANMARHVYQQLRTTGRVSRGWLGIFISDLDPRVAVTAGVTGVTGAVVTRVVPGGPAEVAGLRPGDVILRFDGREIPSSEELPWIAAIAGIGTTVPVEIARGRERLTVQVVMGAMPE